MWNTVMVGDVDLSELAVIEDMSGLSKVAPLDAEPLAIPGRPGAVFMEAEHAGFAFDVPLTIRGRNRDEVDQVLRALFALLDTRSAPVSVQRRMILDGEEIAEQAECVVTTALVPQYLGRRGASLVITFFNLDGGWTPVAYS